MGTLSSKQCVPCKGGEPPLKPEAVTTFLIQTPEWKVVENHHLLRSFRFKDFVTALSFVNKIGELAEQENHHPDIILSWGKVVLKIFTHKIDGLHENDFILASKMDQLAKNAPGLK